MCDISFSKRTLVVYLILCLAAAEPQLDLPPYDQNRDPNDYNYDRNPDYERDSYDRDPNYDRNLNYNVNNQNNVNPNNPNPNVNPNVNQNQVPQQDDDRRGDKGYRYNGDIRQLLQALDLQASQQCTSNVAAQWNFETNVNQVTQLEAPEDDAKLAGKLA